MMEREQKDPKTKNHALNAVFGTVLIVLLGVALLLVANSIFPFQKGFRGVPISKSLMLDIFIFKSALSLSVFGLSLFLTYIYLKDYLELRSRFTLGILFAVISFMMYALTSIPILHRFFGIHPINTLGMFDIIPLLFSAIALAILAWVSSK